MRRNKKYMGDEVLEENIYSKKQREMLLEDEELSPEEEAFMRGWEKAR